MVIYSNAQTFDRSAHGTTFISIDYSIVILNMLYIYNVEFLKRCSLLIII